MPDSENAKAMMPEYHIGKLDAESLARLTSPEPADAATSGPRPVFLQQKAWSKAMLTAKRSLSSDTKLFTFTLDHTEQQIGLPVGQHLMMRLRDKASQETVIRAYTPISETSDKGQLLVLVKIYADAPGVPGGRMTQSLDALPLPAAVEFKGPVGKFQYLGGGRCLVSGRERRVRRFIMVCAGSGVTPIFQVLRAAMRDRNDPTACLVLDGNRAEEDILCRAELDELAALDPQRCRLLHTLTRPEPHWGGLRGRMDRTLFEREVGLCKNSGGDEDDLVLVCGPEAMEKSVKAIFLGMNWAEDDLLFF
jgi:nitrate reductase (NAD(P)H)